MIMVTDEEVERNWHVVSNDAGVFSIYLMVRAGAVHEPSHMSGVSHVLEHLLFHTPRVRSTLRELNARANASTSHDYTSFRITLPADGYRAGVALMHRLAMVFDSISPSHLEAEKRVVMQEDNEVRSEINDGLWCTAFEGTVLAKSVIGSAASVSSLTLDAVRAYHRERYTNNGCIVCASCPPSRRKAVSRLLRDTFGGFGLPAPDPRYDVLRGRDTANSLGLQPAPCEDGDGERDKSGQKASPILPSRVKIVAYADPAMGSAVGCRIAFRGYPYDRRTDLIVSLIVDLLSGDLDRLNGNWFGELREARQHVYRLHLSGANQTSCGGAIAMAFASTHDILRVLRDALRLVGDVATGKDGGCLPGVRTRRDFSAAKAAFRAKRAVKDVATGGVESRLGELARDAFYHDALGPTKKKKKNVGPRFASGRDMDRLLDGISKEETEAAAREIFSSPLAMVIGNNNDPSSASSASSATFERRVNEELRRYLRRIEKFRKRGG